MKKGICIIAVFFLLFLSGCAIVPARHIRSPNSPPHIRGPYRGPSYQLIVPPVRFMVPAGPIIVL